MAREKVYLSDLDHRLLKFLMLKGAHYSIYEIGKILRVSPQTVAYKIKQFERKGIILSYRYRVNPYKLGYKNMAWCALDITRNLDRKDLDEKILSHPNVFSIFTLTGQMDMFAKVFYSEHKELQNLIEWLGVNFRDTISRISLVPVMRVEKLNQVHDLSLECDVLDDTSLAILKYKFVNTGASLKKVADALGFHRNTVSRKWGLLWRNGVLLKKSIFIPPEVYNDLGFGVSSCVFIDAIPGEREQVIKRLVGEECVHELFSLAFRHDLLAVMRSSDISHCFDNIRNIYSTRHVYDTETLVILSHNEKSFLPVH
ncbi:Lrp/AsnC family transcriptional regulator [archaeon]|nr:Lrp/AsnC family transcriptional regulator [archaeon]